MQKIIYFILINTFFLVSCSNNNTANEKVEKESYEKAKESLEEKERKNPTSFLKVNSKDRHNLIGQTVIKGTINNTAKVCVYKDVELEISYFSKTNVLLQKDNETIYQVIEPNKEVDFKTKNYAPKQTDSISVKVIGAKVN